MLAGQSVVLHLVHLLEMLPPAGSIMKNNYLYPYLLLLTVGLVPAMGLSDQTLPTVVIVPTPVQSVHSEQGLVEAVERVSLTAEVGGRVAWVGVDLDEYAERGSPVLRLRSEQQQADLASARADLAEAVALEREAKDAHRRTQALFEKQVATQAQLDGAKAAYHAAVARHAAAKARLAGAEEGLGRTTVSMPFSGVIKARLVEPGEVVTAGQPLFDVVSPDALRVIAAVPQSLVSAVRALGKAWIELPGARVVPTRLTFAPGAQAMSHSVTVRLDLPAEYPDLLPGMFVRVGFATGTRLALLVPSVAVVRRSEVVAVYVVAETGEVALRQIRPGRLLEGGQVEVLAGLKAGERVALDPVRAAFVLKERRPGLNS
ncbi:MAG: efflux RND transporter periplasmic adaptor subunit [Gammaproteobacteria bacterium]|nr:efflux RND transporter periplasmic adaptor subunit [Gammaproteobacteria bacterium]